jgi:hypothetical protein
MSYGVLCEKLRYYLAYVSGSATSLSTGLASGKQLNGRLAQVLLKEGFDGEQNIEPVPLPAHSSHDVTCSTITSVLSHEECDALITMTESLGYAAAMIDVHGHQVLDVDARNSGRVMIDSPAFVSALFLRVKSQLPARHTDRDGLEYEIVGFNERLRFLRYNVDQYFKPHIDGSFERKGSGGLLQKSFFTFMVYLDTPEKGAGGETKFYVGSSAGEVSRWPPHPLHCSPCRRGLGSTAPERLRCFSRLPPPPQVSVSVHPRKGCALLFDHNLKHEGARLLRGVKHVLRTDVLYQKLPIL